MGRRRRRDTCAWCHRPLDPESRASGLRWCSDRCRTTYVIAENAELRAKLTEAKRLHPELVAQLNAYEAAARLYKSGGRPWVVGRSAVEWMSESEPAERFGKAGTRPPGGDHRNGKQPGP